MNPEKAKNIDFGQYIAQKFPLVNFYRVLFVVTVY